MTVVYGEYLMASQTSLICFDDIRTHQSNIPHPLSTERAFSRKYLHY